MEDESCEGCDDAGDGTSEYWSYVRIDRDQLRLCHKCKCRMTGSLLADTRTSAFQWSLLLLPKDEVVRFANVDEVLEFDGDADPRLQEAKSAYLVFHSPDFTPRYSRVTPAKGVNTCLSRGDYYCANAKLNSVREACRKISDVFAQENSEGKSVDYYHPAQTRLSAVLPKPKLVRNVLKYLGVIGEYVPRTEGSSGGKRIALSATAAAALPSPPKRKKL